jgi:hypothetical protein
LKFEFAKWCHNKKVYSKHFILHMAKSTTQQEFNSLSQHTNPHCSYAVLNGSIEAGWT